MSLVTETARIETQQPISVQTEGTQAAASRSGGAAARLVAAVQPLSSLLAVGPACAKLQLGLSERTQLGAAARRNSGNADRTGPSFLPKALFAEARAGAPEGVS